MPAYRVEAGKIDRVPRCAPGNAVDALLLCGDVEIAVKILNESSGRVVAARVFRASSPAAGTDGPQAVAAIDAAFQNVTAQMIGWVTRVI